MIRKRTNLSMMQASNQSLNDQKKNQPLNDADK